ncbi:MAG: hypothetical protein KIT14_05450 [bacterium]|nr:hypothetical protein [bacterium]
MGRLLALLDDGDAAGRALGLRAFEVILVLVVAAEYWARAIPKWGLLAPAYHGHLALASVLCLVALRRAWRRPALAALAASHAILVWREFPATGNHAYLEVVFFALAALCATGTRDDDALAHRAIRWLVCVVFFWSAAQKLAYGYWTNGAYLAFSLDSAGFRPVLAWLIDPAELARLSTYRGRPGDGPYLVADWRLLGVSNGTWVVELALAPLFLWRRTRRVAALLGLGLLLGIEVGAREMFFGLVFANAIALYLPGTWHRRAVPLVAVLLAALTLSRLGVLPEMVFH